MSDDYMTSDEILELRATGETDFPLPYGDGTPPRKPAQTCPVCGWRMTTVDGIGTVCEHCRRPHWPSHNYSNLADRIEEARETGGWDSLPARD